MQHCEKYQTLKLAIDSKPQSSAAAVLLSTSQCTPARCRPPWETMSGSYWKMQTADNGCSTFFRLLSSDVRRYMCLKMHLITNIVGKILLKMDVQATAVLCDASVIQSNSSSMSWTSLRTTSRCKYYYFVVSY
jgi:hypothetical protein